MIKVDLMQFYLGLDGQPALQDGKNESLGKLASGFLATATGAGVDGLKFEGWARKLYNDEVFEIDESDFKKLRDFFKDHATAFAMFKGQILRRLDECEKAK